MIRDVSMIALPTIFIQVCALMMEIINTAFVGHLNDPALVAGVGLGNMYVNVFSQSLILGLNGGIVTLAS